MRPACCRAKKGHKMGYSNIMYLDAAEHKYIEECGACNFFGIKRWQIYHSEIPFGFAVDYQHEPSSDCTR